MGLNNEQTIVLALELKNDPVGIGYAEMLPPEAAAAVNAETRIEVCSRFGSFRTLASLLTQDEYAAVRMALDAAAQQSPMVADMLDFLKLPGDEQGNGGGIDLGNAAVRAMLDQLCTLEVAAKIKTHAERTTSRATLLGLPTVYENDVTNARAPSSGVF